MNKITDVVFNRAVIESVAGFVNGVIDVVFNRAVTESVAGFVVVANRKWMWTEL